MFGNFSLFKTPFLGWSSLPTSFVSFFVFYIFSYLLSKTMTCFSGCLMSSAGIQKSFCGIYSVFKCSFDEFVGERVVSPSYCSAIFSFSSSLLFNTLSRFVVTFLPRSKHFLFHGCSHCDLSLPLSLPLGFLGVQQAPLLRRMVAVQNPKKS